MEYIILENEQKLLDKFIEKIEKSKEYLENAGF